MAQFFFQLFDASLQGNDPRCVGNFFGAKRRWLAKKLLMGNTKGWIDQDSNGWVCSIDKSIKNQLLSNSTRDDMSKLKTKLPRIMYHSL